MRCISGISAFKYSSTVLKIELFARAQSLTRERDDVGLAPGDNQHKIADCSCKQTVMILCQKKPLTV